jgi:hypothetical protein
MWFAEVGRHSQQVSHSEKPKGLHCVTMLTFTRGSRGAKLGSQTASGVDEYSVTDPVIFASPGEGLPRRSIWNARSHGHLDTAAFPTADWFLE